MLCQSCGSEVSGEYGFCPVCGARLDPSTVPERPEAPFHAEPEATGKTWAIRAGAAAAGAALGFSISYYLGWTLFILVPIVLFGTGSGEIRRVLSFFALGLVIGLVIGIFMRSSSLSVSLSSSTS